MRVALAAAAPGARTSLRQLTRPAGLAGVLAVSAGIILGALTLRAEHHYSAMRAAGAALNGMATLLATGPSAATAWAGWAAAACFALSVHRLRAGTPEPPAGRDGAQASVAELRAGLRTEFRLVRAAFWGVTGLALADLGRWLWFVGAATGDGLARQALLPLSVEAAGIAAAALVLCRWLRHFAEQLEQLGAL